ncbi:MAG: DEAD/DEAH box helicase [Candidatus Aenigmatarchaeota archaeon]
MMRFDSVGLNPKLVDKAKEFGFEKLTPIQEKGIPSIMEGRDFVGQAETGSGKTVAFALPILSKIRPREGIQVLVLTPTRELCVQVTDVFRDFGDQLGIKTTSVYGGVGIEPQIMDLRTADVVVATPGRTLDHIGRNTINLTRTKWLVLDETDKMFEMGFIEDVEEIIKRIPKQRQTLMFSATISVDVHEILEKHIKNPVIARTKSHVDAKMLKQVYYDIYPPNMKFSLLVHLLKHHTSGLAIVFCATRDESSIVSENLIKNGINAAAIHGGMSQDKRLKSLEKLRKEHIDVLVATDVAARGLDIKNVTHVYNYDVPKTPEEYTHRIGRTARAGEKGMAVTMLTQRDHENFRRVMGDQSLHIEEADLPHVRKVFFNRNVERERPMHSGYGQRRGQYNRQRPRR